ncbi:hypothetical protein [Sporosarcina globispora]|uniref:hypothetical protein n=1 Tax=Sporosarcina globispora TaxID=1459 RepID=UPI000AA7C115|nr:hypothetical protein [Sporosarcina globispora]
MIKQFQAYHGTNTGSAENIMREGVKIKKYSFISAELESVPGDLGMGFYAYDDSYQNALDFITKFHNIDDPKVLKLNLEVDEDKYLDFDDPDNEEIFKQHFNVKQIQNLSRRYKSAKGDKSRQCLDGLIIEYILFKTRLDVDLISKKTYTHFKGLPQLSHFTNGTELCIKNNKIINNDIEVIEPCTKER